MAQDLDLFLNLGALFAVGQDDLNSSTLTGGGYANGGFSFMIDNFGIKVFRYGVFTTAISKGQNSKRLADVTGTVTAAAGETNSTVRLSDTGNWTVIDSEQGKLCHITDDVGGAGAAPEGEVALVQGNTLSTMRFDADYALTAAPAAGDTYRNYSVWQHDVGAAADLAINTFGPAMCDHVAGRFGWSQIYGYNPGTLYDTAAVTAGAAIVAAATGAVKTAGAGTEQLWIGHCPGTIAADLASPFRSLAFFDVLHASQPIA